MLGFCFVYPRGEFEGWHHIIGLLGKLICFGVDFAYSGGRKIIGNYCQ